jgi:uncharacterized protein (TIGR00255 family)
MIRSMTGFGEAEVDLEVGRLRVEIKSVNHRFFNTNLRLLSGMDRLEAALTERLKAAIRRGHVTVSVSLDRDLATSGEAALELDLERARRYRELLETLIDELDLPGVVDLSMLARFGEIFRAPDSSRRRGAEIEEEPLLETVDEALAGLVASRTAEGARLEEALRASLTGLSALSAVVEERAPARLRSERERLRGAIAELMEGAETDEDRLAREIAYLAEKWDVAEELVRLRSHVDLFAETLSGESGDGAGKRLGFVLQEMNREVNTIASKANDAEIQRAAIEMKQEIERMREQVENVE